MTKQTKKLTTIFAVMAITMFAVIAEVIPVGVEGHMLKCHSTQMNWAEYILVPCGTKENIYLSDQLWDEVVTDDGEIPGFKRTEQTRRYDSAYEDTLKLLEPSNSFYIAVGTPEFIQHARVWKSRNTGKFYQKDVTWTKIGD
jgi:hypothetical protein